MKNDETRNARGIITVAGCKGGVGKSVIASALAIEAGKCGVDVILVDADLGGPNLHIYLGISRPERVMSDFLSRRVRNIEEIILDTDLPGVRFISSAGNVPSQANLKFAQKTKIIEAISSLKTQLLIVDIGAGSSRDVMDFFSMTDGGILVTTPEPASIINSYGFMKNVIYRRFSHAFKGKEHLAGLLERGMNPEVEGGISDIEQFVNELVELDSESGAQAKALLSRFRPGIIVSRADSAAEAGVDEKLKAIIRKYLSIEAECLGVIVEDLYVKAAARKMIPFSVFAPDCPAAQSMRRIAARLLDRYPVDTPIEAHTA
jgi:flagellar biosynthesis protein FlhG